MERIFLGLVLLFFVLAFAIKNIVTYLKVKESIKGKSTKVTLSIVLSTIIYLIIFYRLIFNNGNYLMEIELPSAQIVDIVGYSLITVGFIFGVLALISMKQSWRVGIKHDQKTQLITKGIYRVSRNPYFFSYIILILGFIFVFASILVMLLYIWLTVTFHRMIIEEEHHLETMHGQQYLNYKKNVNRYI